MDSPLKKSEDNDLCVRPSILEGSDKKILYDVKKEVGSPDVIDIDFERQNTILARGIDIDDLEDVGHGYLLDEEKETPFPETKYEDQVARLKETFDELSGLTEKRQRVVLSIINNLGVIPEAELENLNRHIEDIADKNVRNYPVLPKKVGKKLLYESGIDPVKHLERTWGKYLTYYNKDLREDVLYRDYLWEHDPSFMRKLYNRLRYLHTKDPSRNPAPEKIIKRRSDRVSREIEGLTPEQAQEYRRKSAAVERRLKMG